MQTEEQVQGDQTEETIDDFGSAFAEDEQAAPPVEEDATPQVAEEEVEEPVTQPEQKEEPKREETPAAKDEPIDWEKRARDNQSAFTRSQQELAAIREELAALKKQAEKPPEPKPEPEPVQELPENVKELFETYPEMKPAIETVAQQLIKQALGGVDLQQVVTEREQFQKDRERIGQALFERDVMSGFIAEDGTHVDGHPDFYKVITNKGWPVWVKEKGYDTTPCDAKTAISRISEFKESILKKGVAEHEAKQKTEAEKLNETMAGSLKSKPAVKPTKKADPEDFGAGFRDD